LIFKLLKRLFNFFVRFWKLKEQFKFYSEIVSSKLYIKALT